MNKRLALVLLSSIVLSSCGGGGGSSLPAAPPAKSAATQPVSISLVLPATSAKSSARHAQFVSPSALGASIAVTGAQGGSGSAVVDLSSTSTACTTSGSQRTCQASVQAPVDTDTFTITLYDAAPVNNTIPSTAHVLGIGKVTQAITSSFTGKLPVVVGGSISSIGLGGTFLSLPSGHSISAAIAVNPTDFGNNPLSGSSAPYANPITVSLTESGGSGHMQLVLNGTASGSTAKLTQPSDTLAVQYDGSGSAGYSANVSLTASGAPAEALTVSPLFLSSTSTFFANGTAMLSGSALSVPITITEANAPATVGYTAASGTGCSGIATVGAVNGSGASATVSVTGGSTASANGCSISVSDNGGTTVQIAVINSPVGGTIPLPGASVQEYTLASSPPASPQALALGPDGNIWLSDVLSNHLWSVTKSGVATQYNVTTIGAYPGGLIAGSDGHLWAADSYTQAIDKIDTSTGNALNQWGVSYTPRYIAAGSDGNMWFTEIGGGGFGLVGNYSPGGVLTEYDLSSGPPHGFVVASPVPAGIASNPLDGSLWFCDDVDVGTPRIDAMTTTGVASTKTNLTHDCSTIAFQPDGKAAWATSASTNEVYRIDTTSLAVTPITLTGSPSQVVAGADGAMYVTEYSTQGLVARISLTSPYAISEIPTPSTGAIPTGIALGADGRMWFGENTQNRVGALAP